jgi:ArsR family transcriptional regulator, arsenate/arsenite/antimonite-responsive transcriptional repressor
MEKIVEIMKAASDPTRIRILMALQKQELCVCQITELLELAPSTISKHMSILKHAKFVQSRKNGKWIYYRISNTAANVVEQKILKILNEQLCIKEEIVSDRARLKKILTEDKEVICSKVCCRKKSSKGNS